MLKIVLFHTVERLLAEPVDGIAAILLLSGMTRIKK